MTPSHTIRLFVSSTFKDLKAERDALQREVFPRLKQLCLSKGLRFQAIDLRWGISQEAGRDNQTMRICLRELRRCQQDRPKPNFLVLLGDRYGWRPLPEVIPATLFEKLEKEVRARDAKAAKLLTDSYRRDDNAVPPIYELQPRGDLEHWHDTVGTPLRVAMETAAAALPDEPGLAELAIGLGATHQEILHGALKLEAKDAREHVHAFIRSIRNLSDAPPPGHFVDPDANAQTQGLLDQLKGQLVEHLGKANVHPFTMEWQTGGADDASGFTEASFKQFCDDVYSALSSVIEKQIAALAKVPPEQQEDQVHQDFGRERCRRFVGRAEPLERIAQYLKLDAELGAATRPLAPAAGEGGRRPGEGDARHVDHCKPLAVLGPAGSGKSALMAKAVERLQETEVIARYIGATPGSSDLVQLLRNLVAEIRRRYPAPQSEGGARHSVRADSSGEEELPTAGTESHALPTDEERQPDDSEIPFEYNPLVTAFHEALQRPTAERPLFLFLDALDQLTASNNAHSLAWLPGSLNPEVRLIVSAALPSDLNTLAPSGGEGRGEGVRASITISSPSPLSRPADTLSPSDGERDRVRGGVADVRSPAFTRSGPPEGGTPNDPRSGDGRAGCPQPAERRGEDTTPYLQDPRSTILAALTSRLDAGQRVTLAPLTVADGEEMLTNWLADSHRTLQPAQRQAILETFQVEGSPLWLRVAMEEATRLASWQPAPAFASTTPGLLGQVLDRLSREEEHGKVLVFRTLGYLACARHGLAEDEILDILSADKKVMASFWRRSPTERRWRKDARRINRLPVAVWVRLHGDLAFYLAEYQAQGASLLGFYHRSFLEAVTAHCFESRQARETRHQHLAWWFGTQPLWLGEEAAHQPNARKCAELPFQLTAAARWEELGGALCSFGFLEATFRAGIGGELESVFESALGSWPESSQVELRSKVLDFQSALRQEGNNFRRFSGRTGMMPFRDFLFQQLRNRIHDNSQGAHDPPRASLTNLGPGPLLLHQRPNFDQPFVRTFDADPGSAILRFGGKVRFTPDGKRLVVACVRERIPVFDVSRGHETGRLECLGRARTMDFSDDASKMVVGGDAGRDTNSGFLQVLDLATGESLVGKMTDAVIHGLAVTSHGQVFCCCAGCIRVYSAADLQLITEWCPYDGAPANAIAVNRGRTLVATGEYHDQERWARISVWDAGTFRCLAQFEGQKYGITALAFSDDDLFLASGSNHVASGVVAWSWLLPGTEWDVLLLSQKTPDDVRQRLIHDPRVRTKGRVISILGTSGLVQALAFYPRSSWLVAAEGAPNIPSDAINIFDVLGARPGQIAKVSGHSSAPVAIDVDPAEQYVASLHADAKVVLWSAESLRTTHIAERAEAVGNHSVDDACTLILSQSQDNYRSLRLTNTEAGRELLGPHTIPSFHAVVDPVGRYVARFYWAREPVNPNLGGDAQLDESSKRWWQHFQASTPTCLTLHAIGQLLAMGQDHTAAGWGLSTIEWLTYEPKLAQWELPLGLNPTNLLLGPDGSWGASLLKDQEGLFWLFRFDVDRGKSCVEWLPWKMTQCAIFPTHAGDYLGIAVVCDEIALRLFDPKAEAMRVVSELTGLGVTAGLTHGPFLLSGHRCLVVRDHQAVSVLGASSTERSPEGDWQVFNLTNECSCEHDSGIRDATVSRDEQLLVLLDAEPSVCIRRLSDLKLLARRPLDSKFGSIRISRDGQRILAIGDQINLARVSHSLMQLSRMW